MAQEFSSDEQKRLAAYFTNLERDTFGLKLPQEVAGALFSRYSRSAKSLRRTFLDEFLGDAELGLNELLGGQIPASDDSAALKKARAFFERVLVGYGDDSVAQLGGAHIACENISNVAAKLLEDARIGIAPLEKSTRYVRFDQQDAGQDEGAAEHLREGQRFTQEDEGQTCPEHRHQMHELPGTRGPKVGNAMRPEQEADHRAEKHHVAEIENSALKRFKVSHDRERRDDLHESRACPA